MIFCEPDVNKGAPTLRGRSTIVGDVVEKLNRFDRVEDFLADSPIKKDELMTLLRYCRDQKCVSDKALRFCPGCKLSNESVAGESGITDARAAAEALFAPPADNQDSSSSGGPNTEEASGKEYWRVAEERYKDLQNRD